MIPDKYLIKNTVKYVTSVIVGGTSKLGLEIIDSLLEQGGYVIVVDVYSSENITKLDQFGKDALISFVDYANITYLEEEIRRLDYVFYLAHESRDVGAQVSSQQFLSFSNYLDTTLSLAVRFDAKFILTTSVRAHQMNISLSPQEANFSLVSESQLHSVYTEREIQRYAESLTIEYYTKKKLDARIVRLGEIIGDGIDFLSNTPFVEMILSVVKDNVIVLKKDGLETEFLVHILDASYGIIKALFSQSTAGKIYTIAYEHAYTHLSLAYKIQDVNPDLKEIIFTQEKDNLPSLKLYKPAPNLSTIGWLARVPIERAIKQSLAAAKIFLLETEKTFNEPTSDENKKKSNPKLQKFFALVKKSEEVENFSDDHQNTITELIKQRKKQEELKKAELSLASERIKKAKKIKNYTAAEKFQHFLWDISLSIASKLKFLKNKSPAQIIFITAATITFLFFYVFLIGPMIAITRNVVMLETSVSRVFEEVNSNNLREASFELDVIEALVKELLNLVDYLSWFFDLVGLKNQKIQVVNTLSWSELYLQIARKIIIQFISFQNLLELQEDNLILTSGSDSFLKVTSAGNNLTNKIDELEALNTDLEDSKKLLESVLRELSKLDFTVPIVGDYLYQKYLSLQKITKEHLKFLDTRFVTDLLSSGTEKNFAILIVDNTRPKPRIGDLAGLVLLTVKSGSITSIISKPYEEINFDLSTLQDETVKTVNLTRFTQKAKSQITFADLMSDITPNFQTTVGDILESTFGKKIDSIVIMSLTSLLSISKDLNSKVSISGIEVNALSDIVALQDTNRSLVSRNKAIMEFASRLLEYLHFEALRKDLDGVRSFVSSLESDNVELINFKYRDILTEKVYEYVDFAKFNNFLSIYLNTEDPLLSASDRVPQLSLSVSSSFDTNLKESTSILIRLPNLGLSSELSICYPASILNADFQVLDVPASRVVVNSYDDIKCTVLKILNELVVNLKFQKQNFLVSQGPINFSYLINKSPGLLQNLDIDIQFDDSFKVLLNGETLFGNKFIRTYEMLSDNLFNLNVSKN
ncbi:NAD(P)-dependent oxidoreductase [Candidatus Dojkabacteria bacterium]|uniref:NAD(P)-dependent oxidoreductase n=1 Tax=Candidatus Dojkabacteria bacterium TaxID=2099670 RepID=A0A3M0Z616_9BACT|nr:MAG: NAD(P)-dependent oxidoreductase [Candidatus Dojkabacteria bacterium]